MNFDDLPQEIKIKILSIHDENNFKEHKSKFLNVLHELRFNIVLHELQGLQDEIFFYYDFDDGNSEQLFAYGLSFFLLDYMKEISNLEY